MEKVLLAVPEVVALTTADYEIVEMHLVGTRCRRAPDA
jgi:hypothetical protein